MEDALAEAESTLRAARALLITAGAGMGVDSGLPDFRGNNGFWKAYPPFAKLGLGFVDLANPDWFFRDPELAWGFYGHRLELYRATVPHAGFVLLRDFAARLPGGAFVFTSNVDGQFQKAGFGDDRICEAHGSIHHAQCVADCDVAPAIWGLHDRVDVDHDSMRARAPLPRCPACGGLARPNILMFGDSAWRHARSVEQQTRLNAWLATHAGPGLVIVELGAGSAVPTVRHLSERLARREHARLVRVNPREPEGPPGTLSLALPALEGLRRIVPIVPIVPGAEHHP